jgi:glutaredoxin-like protein
MIPLGDQETIRELFEEELTGPVKLEFFTQKPSPVFVPGRDECRFCADVQQMLEELTHLSAKISLRVHEWNPNEETAARYGIQRVPATVLRGVLNRPIVYYGLPAGQQFTVLIEAIVAISAGATGLPAKLRQKIKRVKRELPVEVYVSLQDPYSPQIVQLMLPVALESSRIRLSVIEVEEFQGLAERQGIQTVPMTVIDGRVNLPGVPPPLDLLDQIVRAAETAVVARGPRTRGTSVTLGTPSQRSDEGEVRPSGLIIPRR